MTDEVVASRLSQCGATNLHIVYEAGLHDQLVDRSFLSRISGGNGRSAIVGISQKKRVQCRHSHQLFFCPIPDRDLHAPRAIGDSGLILLAFETVFEASASHPLFIRVQESPCRWQYAGHYSPVPAQPLTKEEWVNLDEVVLEWCCSSATSLIAFDRLAYPCLLMFRSARAGSATYGNTGLECC